MDTFDIKWLGGYVFYDFRFIMDNDQTPVQSITYRASPTGAPSSTGTPLTIFPETEINYRETRAFFSNELNLVSTGSGPLQWILGAYAYQENSQRPIYLTLPQEPMADSVLSLVTFQQIPNPERAVIYTNGKNLFNAYGAYGQADYEFNDQWKVTAGARYSLDLKNIREEGFMRCLIVCGAPIIDLTPVTQTGAAPGFVGPQPGVATATATNTSGIIYDPVKGQSYRLLKDSWDAVTGTLGVEYRPMDGALLFGRYSRGYKSGGFNSEFFSPLPRTDEETMDSYEIGWKQEWMDWDLTTNLALFHYNYHDTQIPLTVDPPLGLNYSQFVNIPEIESNGVELESFWRPIDDLQLMFTYAYLDTEVTESGGLYFNALTQSSQDITSNPLPFASKNKVAFNARYTFHLPDGSTLMPSVNYFWRDSFATNIFNHPRGEAPSYGQTDARLIWNDTSGQYTVSAWVRNVFDDEGYESVGASLQQSTGQILQSITPTPPRTYGVELQFRF